MAPARSPTLLHTHHYYYLLILPVLLAIATAVLLFFNSDLNVAMLYSQCHSRALLPGVSRIPVLGTPVCFLLSFFYEALASVRSFAVMSGVLSFVGGLLTVSMVESARICNGPNVLIAYPTGAWLVFNLIGGALVWELIIIPAFFHRAKEILRDREEHRRSQEEDVGHEEGVVGQAAEEAAADPPPPTQHAHDHPSHGSSRRHLRVVAEVYAIPAAVAVGFVLPSLLMLVYDTPAAIAVWLFFPVYVTVVRQAVRFLVTRVLREEQRHRSHHLESNTPSLVIMYAIPVVCSALSHGLAIYNFAAQRDDRREMTRSTLRFIEIDFLFIALTVLYWLLVEAGWRIALVSLAASLALGPGAGICVGWYFREHAIDPETGLVDDTEGGGEHGGEEEGHGGVAGGGARRGSGSTTSSNEETPLLAGGS